MKNLIVLFVLMMASAAAIAGSTWYPGGGSSGGGTVTAVTGTPPIASSGGTTPAISISQSSLTGDGYLSSGDWKTFNSKSSLSLPVSTANGGTNATSWTAGSIPYLSNTTTFAQDNANFSWDGTNHRLGIGTSAPAFPFELKSSFTVTAAIQGAALFDPVVTGHAVNDTPAGIYANPTFASGGFGGVEPSAIRAKGNSALALSLDSDANDGVIQRNYSNATEQLRVTTAGQMYISGGGLGSASSPDYGFLSDLNSGFYTPTSSQLAWSTASTERMRLTNTGLGIGSATPGSKLDVAGTVKLGTAGVAFTAMGGCTISSTTITTTVSDLTCTGVPASAAVSVICTGQAAFSTATANGLYCRATGTVSQVECNTVLANTQAMAYSCSWVQP